LDKEVFDMRKLWTVAIVLVVPIFISTGAWAFTVDDTEGAAGAYYGGIATAGIPPVPDPTYAHDIVPNTPVDLRDQWSVTSMTVTSGGGNIQVKFEGPYFGSSYANLPEIGAPGDLYISSKGWVVATPSLDGHAIADTFNQSTEGWDYVVKYMSTGGNLNTSLYKLDTSLPSFKSSSDQGAFSDYRTGQAWRGGYDGAAIASATSKLVWDTTNGSLTFTFPDLGGSLNSDTIGYHWTMGCGNDVVEDGKTTQVPEPASLLLLGLGLVGIAAVYRKKSA
jgi:hypothetical protein